MKKILSILVLFSLITIPVMAEAASGILQWEANTETDLAGYKIYRELKSCAAFGAITATNKPLLLATVSKVTTYTDNTIPDNVIDVCYWLTAVDTSANISAFSVSAGKKFAIALSAPTPFTQVNGTFSWGMVAGATGYLLRVHESGTPYDPCSSMTFCNDVGTLTGTSKVVLLKPNTLYDVWVQAHDATGKAGLSTGMSFTSSPPDTIPPVEPKGLKVTKNTEEQVIIVASRLDCSKVLTTTIGTTTDNHKRTITCVK